MTLTRETDWNAWELGRELGVVVNTVQDFGNCVAQLRQVHKGAEQPDKVSRTLVQWAVGLGHGLLIYLDKLVRPLESLGIRIPDWANSDDYASGHYRGVKDMTPWTLERLEADKKMFQAGIETLLARVKNRMEQESKIRSGLYELALFVTAYTPGDSGTEEMKQAAARAELPPNVSEAVLTALSQETDRDNLRKLADRLSYRVRRYLFYGTADEEDLGDDDTPPGLDDFQSQLL